MPLPNRRRFIKRESSVDGQPPAKPSSQEQPAPSKGGGDFTHSDALFDVEEEYELESGRAKPGAGRAMRDAIMNS